MRPFALFLTVALTGCGPSEADIRAQKAVADAAIIKRLKDQAAASLIDPGSAQFRRVSLTEAKDQICGEINGKNHFGGYTGFTAFRSTTAGMVDILPGSMADAARIARRSPNSADYPSFACYIAAADSEAASAAASGK